MKFFEVTTVLVLAAGTTLGNLVVVLAVYKDPFNDLRTVPNYLLINLAVADLILGLVTEPIYAIQYWVTDERFQIAVQISMCLVVFASGLTVLFLTVERYMILEKPLRIERFLTKVTLKVCISIIWLLAFILSFLRFAFGDPSPVFNIYDVYDDILLTTGCFILIGVLGLNLRIFILIRNFNCSVTGLGDREDLRRPLLQTSEELITSRRREQKVAVSICLYISVFLGCWVPFELMGVLKYFISDSQAVEEVHRFFLYLGILNSALNPFIYSITMQSFRRAIRFLFRSCPSKR